MFASRPSSKRGMISALVLFNPSKECCGSCLLPHNAQQQAGAVLTPGLPLTVALVTHWRGRPWPASPSLTLTVMSATVAASSDPGRAPVPFHADKTSYQGDGFDWFSWKLPWRTLALERQSSPVRPTTAETGACLPCAVSRVLPARFVNGTCERTGLKPRSCQDGLGPALGSKSS